MPATALDLPAELIRRIADEIVTSTVVGLAAVDETHNLWPLRDVLSHCSLTCRYWSNIFRSYIFFEVKLKCSEDVTELSSLIEAPGSQIRTFIEVLQVTLQDWTIPWLHHISSLTEKLPKFSRVTLDFEKPPFGLSISSLTTLHPLLPTTLPAHFSNFASLSLSANEFNNFSELMRLVRGLPALQDITCSQINWKERTPTRDLQRGLYFPKHLRDVSTVACQEDAPMLWLFTTNKKIHAAKGSPPLSVPMMSTIIDIVEALLRCRRTRDQPQALLMFATSMHVIPPVDKPIPGRTYIHPSHWQVLFRSTLTGPAFLARFILVAVMPFAYVGHIFLEVKLSRGDPETLASQDALADELVQNPLDDLERFPVRSAAEELLAVEWGELDALWADMTGLRSVDVEADLSGKLSKEEFASAVDAIHERMPAMGDAPKLTIKGINLRPAKVQTASLAV
ncbi:hypothetical protein PHLGIDRAFT_125805 [Phlebiopsis gigantea 11061_1 CR5-6]|uniref:F-box domain-containing protein n=1 Tax=Phlebiopsis gigantea (strain 11061_1 CR5-6) TaxID=745531 RepID=A0A0C3SE23_PHLG1|nr:hypothetical protein PHLGIDRAFT_125805 [Phlebiopsis gigantea 11061_1 CR5-6]